MPSIDRWRRRLALCAGAWLAGCSRMGGALPAPAEDGGRARAATGSPAPVGAPEPAPAALSLRRSDDTVRLPAPRPVRSWAEVRLQAALRMVAAHPAGTYTGAVPETLLAIPVLEIELHGDGSVRRILVLRPPRQAKDTVEIAMAAVRRAAPFGDVSRLPRPWRFVETFLFDDERRFKPRTLDT